MAFGEYIKFFKGSDVLNANQAASLDGFPSEVLSRGTVGSCQQTARKVALTDE